MWDRYSKPILRSLINKHHHHYQFRSKNLCCYRNIRAMRFLVVNTIGSSCNIKRRSFASSRRHRRRSNLWLWWYDLGYYAPVFTVVVLLLLLPSQSLSFSFSRRISTYLGDRSSVSIPVPPCADSTADQNYGGSSRRSPLLPKFHHVANGGSGSGCVYGGGSSLLQQRWSVTTVVGLRSTLSSHDTSNNSNKREDEDQEKGEEEEPVQDGASLYIHIPYCRKRCRYCDFAIVPIGTKTSTDDEDDTTSASGAEITSSFQKMDETYRKALLTEIHLLSKHHHYLNRRRSRRHNQYGTDDDNGTKTEPIKKIPLKSVYFGGGTPSLAPLSTIRSVLDALRSPQSAFYLPPPPPPPPDSSSTTTTTTTTNNNNNQDTVEITIEMDPGTFTTTKLQSLQQLGINRISLGIQSFDDTVLTTIGRVHRRSDILSAIKSIRDVYGPSCNYSIDLISGLPGLDRAKWIETLQMVLSGEVLDPPPVHMSLYDLQVEGGTVFGNWYKDSLLDGDDDDNDDDDNDDDDDDGGGGGKEKKTEKKAQRENEEVRDKGTTGDTSRTRLVPSVPTVTITANGNGDDETKKHKHTVPPPPLPSAEDCAFMYRFASFYLRRKGYEHYEISSFARLGEGVEMEDKKDMEDMEDNGAGEGDGGVSRSTSIYRSRHNQAYWKVEGEWYAVGMSATSSFQGKRYSRPRLFADYIAWVNDEEEKSRETLARDDDDDGETDEIVWTPAWMSETRDVKDTYDDDVEALLDVILTRLRTKEGLDLGWIKRKEEKDYDDNGVNGKFYGLKEKVMRGAELGLELGFLKIRAKEGRVNKDNGGGRGEGTEFLYLTDPDGFLFSNNVISSIFTEIT